MILYRATHMEGGPKFKSRARPKLRIRKLAFCIVQWTIAAIDKLKINIISATLPSICNYKLRSVAKF